jgi:hypothetical protein
LLMTYRYLLRRGKQQWLYHNLCIYFTCNTWSQNNPRPR